MVPARRAVRLVLDRKAEMLEENPSRAFATVDERYACPEVIRLARFVRVPRKLRKQVTNTFLFARDAYRCMYCGRGRRELGWRTFLTRDHVRPVSRGGGEDWTNVVTACSTCNHRKGDRLPEEAGMRLRETPREPNHVRLVWTVRTVTPVQAKYLRMFFGESWKREA